MRWSRRLILIAVFGYAIGEVGLLLGLSDIAHDAFQKAVGLVLHVCLAIIVMQKRRAVRRRLRAPPEATGAGRHAAQPPCPGLALDRAVLPDRHLAGLGGGGAARLHRRCCIISSSPPWC